MSRLSFFLSCFFLPLTAFSHPAGTLLMTPNLKISGSPSLTVNGLVIQASLTVINNGNGPAGLSNLRFYISTDQSISDSDYWLGMQTLPPLAAGETTQGTLDVDICNMGLPPGTYYLGYSILGQIIEQIIGTNYEQWVQQNILAPAGICGEMEIGETLLSEKLPREVEYFSPYKTLSAFGDGTLVPWQYGGFYTPSMDSHGLSAGFYYLQFSLEGKRRWKRFRVGS